MGRRWNPQAAGLLTTALTQNATLTHNQGKLEGRVKALENQMAMVVKISCRNVLDYNPDDKSKKAEGSKAVESQGDKPDDRLNTKAEGSKAADSQGDNPDDKSNAKAKGSNDDVEGQGELLAPKVE